MRLVLEYLSLCWFRNNPAHLQPSKPFMMKAVLFYLISGTLVESLIADPADGTLEVLLRTVMAFSSIAALLLAIKKWQFYNQLFTAIFMCENFIMTLAIAAEALDFYMVFEHFQYREEVSTGLAVFLVTWYLAAVSYILRQIFQFRFNASVGLAFGYFVLTYGLPMMFMDI